MQEEKTKVLEEKKEEANPEIKLGDPIPDYLRKKLEDEVKNGYRIVVLPRFRDKENVVFHIYNPDVETDAASGDAYTIVFNKLLSDPYLMTKKQLTKVLLEKGIWTKDNEDEVEEIGEQMRDIEYRVINLKKSKNFNANKLKPLRKEWETLRDKRHNLLIEKSNLLSNTIEGRAEEAEARTKLLYCIKYSDGTRVWSSPEELNKETDRTAIFVLTREATFFWAGLSQEMVSDLPADIIFGREDTLDT